MKTIKETTTSVPPADFVGAMNHFASGVAVVTTADGDRLFGATVAAIAPISSEPPTVMVSMSSMSSTAAAIVSTGTFTINILDEDAATIAGIFASRSADKFARLQIGADVLGNPTVPSRVASISCCLVESVAAGSHLELRGRAVHVDDNGGHPLTYYRGSFAHLQTDADQSLLDSLRARVLGLRHDQPSILDPERLAQDLGAPRGSVLRALSSLKSEALVERIDGAYQVATVSDDIVDTAYQAKLVLELGVATCVIDRVTDAEIDDLRERVERLDDASRGEGAAGIDALVTALHDVGEYFVGLSECEPLVRAYRSLGLPGLDRRTITAAMYANLPREGGFYGVVAALEARDLDRLLDALRSPLRSPAHVRDLAQGHRAGPQARR